MYQAPIAANIETYENHGRLRQSKIAIEHQGLIGTSTIHGGIFRCQVWFPEGNNEPTVFFFTLGEEPLLVIVNHNTSSLRMIKV